MRTREYRYYNNEKQILLSIHYQNNFDHLLSKTNMCPDNRVAIISEKKSET